jgi:hypothetical protein
MSLLYTLRVLGTDSSELSPQRDSSLEVNADPSSSTSESHKSQLNSSDEECQRVFLPSIFKRGQSLREQVIKECDGDEGVERRLSIEESSGTQQSVSNESDSEDELDGGLIDRSSKAISIECSFYGTIHVHDPALNLSD